MRPGATCQAGEVILGLNFTEKPANRVRVPAIQDDAQGC